MDTTPTHVRSKAKQQRKMEATESTHVELKDPCYGIDHEAFWIFSRIKGQEPRIRSLHLKRLLQFKMQITPSFSSIFAAILAVSYLSLGSASPVPAENTAAGGVGDAVGLLTGLVSGGGALGSLGSLTGPATGALGSGERLLGYGLA